MTQRALLILVALLLLLFVVVAPAARLLTEAWWYDALGYGGVFGTVLGSSTVLGMVFGLGMAAALMINVLVVRRIRPRGGMWIGGNLLELGTSGRGSDRAFVLGALFLGLVAGLDASARWPEWLLWRNGGPFGTADPIFGQDLGFYVFTLPFVSYVSSWLFLVLLVSLVASAVLHVHGRSINVGPGRLAIAPAARGHLLTLVALLLLAKAWDYHLSAYQLVLREHALFVGASYADVHALLPAMRVLTVLSIAAALAVLVNAYVRGWRLSAAALAALFVAAVVGQGLIPGSVQRFAVAPNELERERPYIEHAIRGTRFAYGLDRVSEQPFAARDTLTAAEVARNRATIQNVRLWDSEQLLTAYSQLQEIRAYYGFFDVDNDRYRLDGRLMQTSLSPREIDYGAPQIEGFINERLTYTHGFGLCMGPVTRISTEGLPEFYVKNLPPQTTEKALDITEPRIYFGERMPGYVYTNTTAREFDYPQGEKTVYNDYAGKGGISAGSFVSKLLFAIRFGEGKILLSDQIREGSRVLFHRSVRERASRVTPLVYYDGDPYMVVSGGRLYWMLDGYTSTADLPYSRRETLGGTTVAYVRNSVKTVVDAYDGTVQAYMTDPEEPIVRSLSMAFPGVYRPMTEMPEDLRAHIRVPIGLLSIQANVLATYHMDDPQVFYNREDAWRVPTEAYYTITRLPGEKSEEFILMVPFVLGDKANLIAWMAARCDGERYGETSVYLLPKDKLIYGPQQIQGRINQDPVISEQLTLWNQRGSQVQWGEMLMIPMEESLLYVQPLYLAAGGEAGTSGTAIPELRRVVVAYGNRIAMEAGIEEAVASVFRMQGTDVAGRPGEQPSTLPAGGPTPGASPAVGEPSPKPSPGAERRATPEEWRRLSRQAREHLEEAEKQQRQGNWAAYGEQLKRLKETLLQMESLSP